MKNIDYSFKSKVLSTGLLHTYKLFRKDLYKCISSFKYESRDIELSITGSSKNITLNHFTLNLLRNKYKVLLNNYAEFLECVKLYNSQKQRIKRLKSRVNSMLLSPCLFLTLTYNNEYLDKTTDKQRRVDITRYLKSFNVPYVANKDYGGKNGREHYHAIIQLPFIDVSTWRYGNTLFAEHIYVDSDKECVQKIAKYIAKLTNHAIKETTKRSALIYSR